jgi:hypothetical protein
MKRNLLSITAVVLALVFSAFTTTANVTAKPQSSQWFILASGGNFQNPNDYSPTSSQPCNSSGNVCGVLAEEDPNNPGHPILDASAQYVRKP